ncbi:SDR family oxidoreductase [Streptomonospora nanhaiensis]|uniref:NAD(P)-dependent dehydrogenase (Short-subunit alcohol dehydrogenase family) n=1 Tax=Streptomonospora nanhaiensis TaxID=1323731 RepID=A0A853BSF0_9ACTN|nr:SDR family oxidoreductase [Streptomonospora nanhaiensis]MBX9387414.1 SDR family oxidoreductase [Streptomonospora nanhaiensis]NYI97477.1 NAD(P)-dependent dehydrogenase (short-subunit alcohol dehydrogenase family) [Streptomonospora nanhaiensis]
MADATTSAAVLITGATGGVGIEAVRALTAKGFRVYAAARNPDAVPRGAGIHPVRLDVTDPAGVAAAADELRAQGVTSLRAVVNNAGIIVQGPLEVVPDDELHRQFDVNVYGPARVIRAFLPMLRAGQGRIVNITAGTARMAVPYLAPISASKAALQSMSDALRVELAHLGVDVVVVEPGTMDTPIFATAAEAAAKAQAGADPAVLALYRDQVAAMERVQASGKPGPPRLVADAIVTAVTATRPKARYSVGGDTRVLGLLSSLPLRTRDRLVRQAIGLDKAAAANTAGAAK